MRVEIGQRADRTAQVGQQYIPLTVVRARHMESEWNADIVIIPLRYMHWQLTLSHRPCADCHGTRSVLANLQAG